MASWPAPPAEPKVSAACATCHARDFCIQCHVNAPEVPVIQALRRDPRSTAIQAKLEAPADHRRPRVPVPAWRAGPQVSRHLRHLSHPGELPHLSCRQACHGPCPPGCGTRTRKGAEHPSESGPTRMDGISPRFMVRWPMPGPSPAKGAMCGPSASTATGPIRQIPPRDTTLQAFSPVTRRLHTPERPAAATATTPASSAPTVMSRPDSPRKGRLNAGYHDAKQFFLLNHGQAARQNLESCVACHAERDCLTCHSAVGGRRFNPHGPGFDPETLRRKNSQACTVCHGAAIPGGD